MASLLYLQEKPGDCTVLSTAIHLTFLIAGTTCFIPGGPDPGQGTCQQLANGIYTAAAQAVDPSLVVTATPTCQDPALIATVQANLPQVKEASGEMPYLLQTALLTARPCLMPCVLWLCATCAQLKII